MANTGTLTAKDVKYAKSSGKPYLRATIDNVNYIGFGKVVESAQYLTVGQAVEYTSAPGEKEGDTPKIVFIKAQGSSTVNATPTATAAPTTTPAPTAQPTYSSTKKDDAILWQVAYKLATELLATTPGKDIGRSVQLLARDLRTRMAQDIEGVKDTDPTVTENP